MWLQEIWTTADFINWNLNSSSPIPCLFTRLLYPYFIGCICFILSSLICFLLFLFYNLFDPYHSNYDVYNANNWLGLCEIFNYTSGSDDITLYPRSSCFSTS